MKTAALFKVTTFVTLTDVTKCEVRNPNDVYERIIEQLKMNVTEHIGVYKVEFDTFLEFDEEGGT